MATKKLVPRATDEGGLGTALKVWGDSWLTNLTLTQLALSTSVSGIVETGGLLEKRNLTTIGIDVQDTEDASCYVGLWEDATGTLLPKTDESLLYNAFGEILTLIGTLKMGSSANANEHVIHRAQVTGLPNGGILSIKAGDTVGGTNQAGGYLNLYPGRGTGTGGGVSSGISLWCSPPTQSGTTTQTYAKNVLFYSLGTHMAQRTFAPVSTNDYYELKVTSHGAATILTVDSAGGSQAHLDYDIDGDIDLKAKGDIIYDAVGADHTWKTNGTQQMHLNSSGLTIDNIPTEAAPVSVLVDNATTPGLVSLTTLSSLLTNIPVTDTNDSTCYVGLWPDPSGNLTAHTDAELKYNAVTKNLEVGNIYINEAVGTTTALNIETLSTTNNVIEISAPSLTTGHVLDISASALAGGNAINIDMNASTDANGGVCGGAIYAEVREVTDQSGINKLIEVDYNKTAGTGPSGSLVVSGVDVKMKETLNTPNHASCGNHYLGGRFNIDAVHVSSGQHNITGVEVDITGTADDYTVGYHSDVTDGGIDFKAVSSVDSQDYFALKTTSNGATTLETIDHAGTAANLSVIADGDIGLSSANDMFIFSDGNNHSESGGTFRWSKAGNLSDTLLLTIDNNGGAKFTTEDAAAANADFEIEADGKIILDSHGSVEIDSDAGDIAFSETNTLLATVKSLRKESFIIACSDETTDLTAGLKATLRMPYAFTLTDIRASLTTAAGGNDFVVDIKQGGVSIFINNLLTIDEGDKTSVGSGSAYTTSSTSLLDDQEITFHVDTIGASTAGAGLKVTLIGYKTV